MFTYELQRSVVEANSRPWLRLADLAEDVAAPRQAVIPAAEPLGLGVVAAGTAPRFWSFQAGQRPRFHLWAT